MTKIIEASFCPNEYGRVWGVLATSSRVGTLLATFVLGGLLGIIAWPVMLYITAGTGLVMAVVFLLTQRVQSPVENRLSDETIQAEAEEDSLQRAASTAVAHPLDGTTLPQAIGQFCRSRQFWLITFSLMGLSIMWDFLMMIPLYLTQTFNLSDSAASQVASAFPFGSLISVLVGGYVFDKLSRRSTAWVMAFLLTLAAGCILTFYLLPGMGMSAEEISQLTPQQVSELTVEDLSGLSAGQLSGLSLGLLFLFGLCVSPCYYIPMSVFSIEFGGPHSGFLIALLDALAFGVTAVFYYFSGDLAERSWGLFLLVLFGVCVWAMLMTLLFMLGEAKRAADNV